MKKLIIFFCLLPALTLSEPTLEMYLNGSWKQKEFFVENKEYVNRTFKPLVNSPKRISITNRYNRGLDTGFKCMCYLDNEYIRCYEEVK